MLGHHPACGRKAMGVGERRCPQDREAERIEQVRAEAAVAERERTHRVAVVGAAEGEERVAARDPPIHPVLEGDLQRLLDRARTVGRVEEVRVVDRHHPGERFGQLDDDRVAVAEHRGVRTARELRGQGCVELGDPVAERGDPERGDRVEVAAAVDVDDLVTLGPVHEHRRVVRVARHLREPVPHHRRVTRDPLVMLTHAADATTHYDPVVRAASGRRGSTVTCARQERARSADAEATISAGSRGGAR